MDGGILRQSQTATARLGWGAPEEKQDTGRLTGPISPATGPHHLREATKRGRLVGSRWRSHYHLHRDGGAVTAHRRSVNDEEVNKIGGCVRFASRRPSYPVLSPLWCSGPNRYAFISRHIAAKTAAMNPNRNPSA